MDVSAFLIIPVSAFIMAVVMIVSEIFPRCGPTFRLAFGLSYLVAVVAYQPWYAGSLEEMGMSVMMLVLMALWVSAGCMMGAIPAALIIAVGRWISRTFARHP